MANALRRFFVLSVAATLACMCLLAFAACGSNDKADFVGEWRIADTEVTVVFSDTEFKIVGNTFDYTVDSGNKTITYTSGGAMGTAKYTFSADKQQLTLDENNGKITVFNKVSSNGDAEPSAGTPSAVAPAQDEQPADPESDEGAESEEDGSE